MKRTSTPQPTETDHQPECSGDLPPTPTPQASSKRSQNKPPTTSQEPSTKKRGRGRPRKTLSTTTFHPPKSHLPSSSRRSIGTRTSTVLSAAATMKPPIPTSDTDVPDLLSAPRHGVEKGEEEEDLRLNLLMVIAGTRKLDLAQRARAKRAAEVFLVAVREIQGSQQPIMDSADLSQPSCGTENVRARSMPLMVAATGPGELDEGLGVREGKMRRPGEGFGAWLGRRVKGEGEVVGKDAAEQKS